jgi:hypothetical protein
MRIPAEVEEALRSSGTRARLGDLKLTEVLEPSHGAACVLRFANESSSARVFYFESYDALIAASRSLTGVQNGSFLVEVTGDEERAIALRSAIAGEE